MAVDQVGPGNAASSGKQPGSSAQGFQAAADNAKGTGNLSASDQKQEDAAIAAIAQMIIIPLAMDVANGK